MDYNISNYGHLETYSNDAVVAASGNWAVPLDKENLKNHKYYNLFMIDSSSPFCTMKCKIEGSREERFVKIKPGATIVVSGHNFRSLEIENLDAITQIQIGQITVTIMKDMDRISYLLMMRKLIKEGVIYG